MQKLTLRQFISLYISSKNLKFSFISVANRCRIINDFVTSSCFFSLSLLHSDKNCIFLQLSLFHDPFRACLQFKHVKTVAIFSNNPLLLQLHATLSGAPSPRGDGGDVKPQAVWRPRDTTKCAKPGKLTEVFESPKLLLPNIGVTVTTVILYHFLSGILRDLVEIGSTVHEKLL